MPPGDNGFSADSSLIGDIVNGLCSDARGPLLPGLVRPTAVIMDHVLTQHQSQVAVTEDQDPVAVITMMILHFIPDEDDPWGIVQHLMQGMTGADYLVLGHAGADMTDQKVTLCLVPPQPTLTAEEEPGDIPRTGCRVTRTMIKYSRRKGTDRDHASTPPRTATAAHSPVL